MPNHDTSFNATNVSERSEGGLRAPPGYGPLRKLWWWFDFIILVNLARLRFIFILIAIGLVIVYWDTLAAHYDRWTRKADEKKTAASDIEYFCPMHPTVVRDNPKDKCPICFMPLSKRKKGETHEESLPPGIVSRVQLSPYRVVLAGVQTWRVSYVPLSKRITSVGYVEFNERELRQVTARVKGRLDQLTVNETGQMVHEKEELGSLYSPELVTTIQNLLVARQNRSDDLERSARGRLKLWGVAEDQIDEIIRSGRAETLLKIRSPMNGHVIKKYVKEGQYVDEGTPLYDLADLSTVWIQAQVNEEDLAFLPPQEQFHKRDASRAGAMPVTATTRAFPNEKFKGLLTFVHPHISADTRTVTVRFELDNPGHKLRPGSSATIDLDVVPAKVQALASGVAPEQRAKLGEGQLLAVPESSIIDTGRQQIVYREVSPGEYEGVKVELGPRMNGPQEVAYFPVLRGLAEGDLIVTAGSFLVDAETRLNPAAGSIYFGGSGGASNTKLPGQGSVIKPSTPNDEEAIIASNLAKLPNDAERREVAEQEYCVTLDDSKLGSMGVPLRLVIEGRVVYICCKGCSKEALADPKATLAKLDKLKAAKKTQKSATKP